ncbi:MBL fold metallo-hydrolase [Hymenobacter humi]|uniref:MBL fold metallo-hydrolase n=1 Tax=Hymenobacter humi TaxID=1411620 RepID=A0ABW2U5C4_9BACT
MGGGMMAYLSFAYPKHAYDFGARVQALPADGSVPGLPGWRWVHTPGHTFGHVSFFREHDKLLVAGDAFTTVFAESGMATYTQKQEVHGPRPTSHPTGTPPAPRLSCWPAWSRK